MRRLAAPAALLLLSGCIATQRDVLDLNQQTDEIKAQVTDLKKTLSGVQANQADLSIKMDEVRSDLSTFTENLKDNEERMNSLAGKIDELKAVLGQLGQKVSALGENIGKQQQALAQAEKAAEDAAQKVAEENKIYHAGEVAFGQGQWEKAAKQFALFLDRYPKSELTPSARFKYASCLVKMKTHLDEARDYLESIRTDFPKSPEAASAAKLLKKLDSAPAKKGSAKR